MTGYVIPHVRWCHFFLIAVCLFILFYCEKTLVFPYSAPVNFLLGVLEGTGLTGGRY